MKMTPSILVIGGLMVFWASVYIMIGMPTMHEATLKPPPSDIWRPLSQIEEDGHRLYIGNGCSYCHSLFIRSIDWGMGAERIAQAGDYNGQEPAILGTERTGPDLSEDGGEHPDDWHIAHFVNPRFTRPMSVMPSWEFLGTESINRLIAFIQSQGLKEADRRVTRQMYWKTQSANAYKQGADRNIAWIHDNVPSVWRAMPNPYPATEPALLRGKKIYQQFCIGCHGPVGDGQGPAAAHLMPPPLNFTSLRRNLVNGRYIGGIFYYQIMNGITGTAMPYFKKELHSEKIWDVSNYVAVYFLGYTDATIPPRGIEASYEPAWKNTFMPPILKGLVP